VAKKPTFVARKRTFVAKKPTFVCRKLSHFYIVAFQQKSLWKEIAIR
jgi:hypothetical protein